MSITLGAFTTFRTYGTAGFDLACTLDDLEQSTCLLEFKRHADATWRTALPCQRIGGTPPDGGPRTWSGKALMLDEATAYDLRVTVGGTTVTGTNPQTATVSTSDSSGIPTLEQLQAGTIDYYVDALTGLDTNPGTAGFPWQTLSKMVSAAPSGARVVVETGYYLPPPARATPLTLFTRHGALDANRNLVNQGLRAVIEPTRGTRPTGSASTGHNAGLAGGPWAQVTPDGNAAHPVWVWAASGITLPTQCGYAATRDGEPRRVPLFKDNTTSATPALWAANVWNSNPAGPTYGQPFGFYVDSSAGSTDLYVRLPNDLDPNTQYLTFGRAQVGFGFSGGSVGSPIRFSGFELRCFGLAGLQFNPAASGVIADRFVTMGCFKGYRFQGTAPATYGADHLVQDFRCRDFGNYDPGDGISVGWNFIKSGGRNGEQSETHGQHGIGGARRVTVRRGTISYTFNGVGTFHTGSGFDRYAMAELEMDSLRLEYFSDDPLEFEDHGHNQSLTRSEIYKSFTGFSAAAYSYGPFYLARVKMLLDNVGNRDSLANPAGFAVHGLKYDRCSIPRATIHEAHVTRYIRAGAYGNGSLKAGSCNTNTMPKVWRRNSVVIATRYAENWQDNFHDEDYSLMVTQDASRGLQLINAAYKTAVDVAAYRTATGGGAHSMKLGGVDIAFTAYAAVKALLANPDAFDFTPSGGLLDAGAQVGNVSDVPYPGAGPLLAYHYVGSAPDLGAVELLPGGSGVTATLALAAGGPALAFAGTVTNPTAPVTATVAVHAGGPTVAFAGKERIKGPFAIAAGGPTLALSGTVTNPIPPVSATFSLTAGGPTVNFSGNEAFPVNCAINAGGPVLSLDGVVTNPPPPVVAADFALSAGGPDLSLSGSELFPATIDFAAGGPSIGFAGTVTPAPVVVIGSFSEHAGGPGLALSGTQVAVGTIALAAGGPGLALSGVVVPPGPTSVAAGFALLAGGPTPILGGNEVFSGNFGIIAGGPGLLFISRSKGRKLAKGPRPLTVTR